MMSSVMNATERKRQQSVRLERLQTANAVNALVRFSSSRSPAETYSKLRIYTSEGRICFQAQSNSGVAVVKTDMDGEMACLVDFQTFSGIINRTNDGLITITRDDNRLHISSEKSSVKIPTFDLTVESINAALPMVVVDSAEWLECESKMGISGLETQIEYAAGVRLYENEKLYMLMSSKQGMCGASMPCEGAGLDACVPLESVRGISAAIKKVGSDKLSLGYHHNWVFVQCGSFSAVIPVIGGKPPHKRDMWERMRPEVKWDVSKSEIIEALRQAELFSEVGASGIDIIPADEGLRIIRDSRNDEGTFILDSAGECEYVIPGNFRGEPARIKLSALIQMLRQCDDDFSLYASGRSLCVESGRYFAGYACMARGQ